ncbi:MAG: acetyl-CoA carboxylase biotin carboxyl carrier protein [Chitinophagales bacterium]|nr:acetyl-CoA carboxylase biotin carboxyl carrier protein [Chitinophagales bacterium]
MDFKQIQELMRLMSKSDLNEMRIEQEGFKILLKKKSGGEGLPQVIYSPQATLAAPVPVAAAPVQETPKAAPQTESPAAKEESKADTSGNAAYITMKSPMIGTFYRASGPDKDPFVKVGDVVRQGSVLCIIEAMKLFNEIESEVSGKIVKVLIEDASPVEYDQPLFIIDPSEA